MHKQNGRYYAQMGWESLCLDVLLDIAKYGFAVVGMTSIFKCMDGMPATTPLLLNMLDAAHKKMKQNPALVVTEQNTGGVFRVRLA